MHPLNGGNPYCNHPLKFPRETFYIRESNLSCTPPLLSEKTVGDSFKTSSKIEEILYI